MHVTACVESIPLLTHCGPQDYLEYMIHGPFRTGTKGGMNCGGIVTNPKDCRFRTTEDSLVLAPATA